MIAPRTRSLLRLAVSALVLISVTLASTTADAADVVEDEELLKELFKGVQADDPHAIEAALSKGADINAQLPWGKQTPLMSSVLNGKAKVVAYLLARGADVTIGEKDGYTPMHGAGYKGRAAIAKMLSDRGVGLRDRHADGYEPAVRACWGPERRHTDTLRFFLKAGVPVDDIYEECIDRAGNDATKKLLEEWKTKQTQEEEL